MTPEKVPIQDAGLWSFITMGTFGILSKITSNDIVSWKWIVGMAGTLICLLMAALGSLSLLGIGHIKGELTKIEGRQVEIKGMVTNLQSDVRVAHAEEKARNTLQDRCIEQIEKELDKMRGVKAPRLGGGELGDGK